MKITGSASKNISFFLCLMQVSWSSLVWQNQSLSTGLAGGFEKKKLLKIKSFDKSEKTYKVYFVSIFGF